MFLVNDSFLWLNCSNELLWILLFVVSIYILKKNFITTKKNVRNNSLPGPYGFPLVGNGPQLGRYSHKKLKEWSGVYGPIYQIKLGQVPVVVLNDLDLIKEALITKKHAFNGRPRFASFSAVAFGKGVVFNDSDSIPGKWHDLKNLMVTSIKQFALSPNTRQNMIGFIYEEIDWLVDELSNLCQKNNTYINPEDPIRLSISNAVCAICFGKRYSQTDKEFMKLLHHNKQFGRVIGPGSLVDVMPWLTVIPYFKRIVKEFLDLNVHMNDWNLSRVTEHFKSFDITNARDIVDLMVQHALNGKGDSILKNLTKKTVTDESLLTPNAHISKDLENIIDKEVLAGLSVDMFGAAQDTLSSVMLFIFMYMTQYPDIQSKVRDEINAHTNGERPTITKTSQMVYLQATFHEILRHSSATALAIPHAAQKADTIAGFNIDKGTVLFLNQYAVNYNEKYWKDPAKFNPDRFVNTDNDGNISLNNEKTNRYIIFSIGSRICPGKELTMIWMSTAMATLLQKCEIVADPLKPCNDVETGLTLKPKNLSINLKKM